MRLRLFFFRGFRLISDSLKRVMAGLTLPVSCDAACPDAEIREDGTHNSVLYETLKDLCHNNLAFFKADESDNGQRLYSGFQSLVANVETVTPLVEHIRKLAPSYDFDENTPGNGYRSFVYLVDSCILLSVKLSRQVCIARDAMIFRKLYYTKEVEACGQLLASLTTCLDHLSTMTSWAEPGELFPHGDHSPHELFQRTETINQYCFYGRCIGFQFPDNMRSILKGISICMAGFSEAYYNQGNIISSVWAGGKFMMDPELRARRVVNISQYADIHFCKAFWFLAENEIMQKLPTFVSPTIAVNRLITIPPQPIQLTAADGSIITMRPPDAHIGQQNLCVRLMSSVKRQGMEDADSSSAPPSRGLIFHCHGGGFVAQSSKSHEVYLRSWASRLGVPLLSVDYSLAPQAPYPRAPQEVFYAYCWALSNAKLLGTTAERIVMVGDSAGANLNMGVCLRLLSEGATPPTAPLGQCSSLLRPPTGLLLAYAPLLVSFVPSPARLLCLTDPLLPFGFMMRCLKAYACPSSEDTGNGKSVNGKNKMSTSMDSQSMDKDFLHVSPTMENVNGVLGVSDCSSFEEISESDLVELQAHKSPTSDHLSDTLSAASLSSEHRTLAVTPTNEDRSQQCVSDFLDKYVLESDTDSEGHKIPVLKKKSCDLDISSGESHTLVEETILVDGETVYEVPKIAAKGIHTRISEAAGSIVGAMSSRFSNFTSSSNNVTQSDSSVTIQPNLDSLITRSPSDEFKFTVPKDPYLSPYWADDELLKKVPPLRILSVQLDPCLDDCVMFAKKMKRLGNPVGLDILEGLPHGFLNFSMMSKEAHIGSMICVDRIKELLDLESLPAAPETDAPQDLTNNK